MGQPVQELLAAVIRAPAVLARGRRLPGWKVERSLVPFSLLSGGVSGRNSKPDDVGARPTTTGSDGLDEAA